MAESDLEELSFDDSPPRAVVSVRRIAWLDRPDPDEAANRAERKFDTTIALAVQAWRRLRGSRSWDDWQLVIAALGAIRARVLAIVGDKPGFGTFNRISREQLELAGLIDIPAPTRRHALQCHENSVAIETWRAGLPEQQRRQLNDPQSVWKAFDRERKGRLSRADELHAKNIAKDISRLAGKCRRVDPRDASTALIGVRDDVRQVLMWLAVGVGESQEVAPA